MFFTDFGLACRSSYGFQTRPGRREDPLFPQKKTQLRTATNQIRLLRWATGQKNNRALLLTIEFTKSPGNSSILMVEFTKKNQNLQYFVTVHVAKNQEFPAFWPSDSQKSPGNSSILKVHVLKNPNNSSILTVWCARTSYLLHCHCLVHKNPRNSGILTVHVITKFQHFDCVSQANLLLPAFLLSGSPKNNKFQHFDRAPEKFWGDFLTFHPARHALHVD